MCVFISAGFVRVFLFTGDGLLSAGFFSQRVAFLLDVLWKEAGWLAVRRGFASEQGSSLILSFQRRQY